MRNFPQDVDARFDGYYGLPGEFLTSSALNLDLLGRGMIGKEGNCPSFIYARNLLPYSDIPESEARGALKRCYAGAHEGCKAVLVQMHKEISQRLGD
ncbi:MAG: hypothetical protein V1909_03130 [Candidatus Micrarchaeota archaeon]